MVFILIALLAAALPFGALAAKAQEFEVSVHNRTGQPAELKVVAAEGSLVMQGTVPAGFSKVTLPEGVQNYWVSSACGNSAGSWNLNVKKDLWIDCGKLGNAAWLTRQVNGKPVPSCSDVGYLVDWNNSPSATWWAFLSQTNWSPSATSTFDQEINRILNLGFSLTWGCVSDFYYDEYYIGV